MAKQAFGGDDDGGTPLPPEERKKISGLHKFGLAPDNNIRDVFWKIMASYVATKKPGIELSELEGDRFALMRAATSILSSRQSSYYGLSPKFIALYTIMMFLDGGWGDTFVEFLETCAEGKADEKREVIYSIKKLLVLEKYKEAITEHLGAMLRDRKFCSIALVYIAGVDSEELSRHFMKELMTIARGDIDQNQANAISAIMKIKDDEVKKSLIVLLSHWDSNARLAAAQALLSMRDDEVKSAAAKKLDVETDDDIKKLLKKIIR